MTLRAVAGGTTASGGGGVGGTGYTNLFQEDANTLGERNGVSPQSFYVYNTYTDTSNYERFATTWSANAVLLGVQAAGTGIANRNVTVAGNSFTLRLQGTDRYVFTTTQFYGNAADIYDLGVPAFGWRRFYVSYTNTATIGAVTINKAAGRVNVAAGATSVVVTNSLCTAAAHVLVTGAQNDTTGVVRAAVAAAGSFTIHMATAPTADMAVNFFIVSAD